MPEWRISKYDPALRDHSGAFTGDDWTSATDIGGVFNGRVLDTRAYLATEDAYVDVAMHFLAESGLTELIVRDLEVQETPVTHMGESGLDDLRVQGSSIHDGERLSRAKLEQVIRLNLRSLLWCKLEEPGNFFIHFGYDYYLYIGSRYPCPESVAYAKEVGLFVEPMDSPYRLDVRQA